MPSDTSLAGVVERNVATLVHRRQREEEQQGLQGRIAAAIGRFTGSLRFVYLHLIVFGGWIAVNTMHVAGLPRFDPAFAILAVFASIEAIFLSTFVLMVQNRMTRQAERRAELDLQVGLLAEHEVTQVLTLVRAIASRLGLPEAHDPKLTELTRDVTPERVLDEIAAHEESVEDGTPAPRSSDTTL